MPPLTTMANARPIAAASAVTIAEMMIAPY
jgi:hypothetical protein